MDRNNNLFIFNNGQADAWENMKTAGHGGKNSFTHLFPAATGL